MSTKDDGGPAYPVPGLEWSADFNGMSLRDWFAGQFLVTYLTDNVPPPEVIAGQCYAMADAMLAERAKR